MLDFQRDIKPYLIPHGVTLPQDKLLHPYYKQSVEHASLIDSVFGDAYPEFLQVDRPKEREKKSHRNFRAAIYKAITKPFRRRLIRTLSAIRNADDFVIEFPLPDTNIKHEDTLLYYTNEEFGPWKSVEEWFWGQVVQRYIDDPNSAAVLVPQIPDDATAYRTVLPLWVGSKQIWYHAEGVRSVICAEKKNPVISGGVTTKDGLILYFFDKESYCVAKQIAVVDGVTQWDILGLEVVQGEDGTIYQRENFPRHYFRVMPVFKVGSVISKTSDDGEFVFYESMVSDAIPNLKTVLQRSSDIDIEALLHTGSLEWQYVTKKCNVCSGDGYTESKQDGKTRKIKTTCTRCKGAGYDIFDSNLEKILISPPTQSSFEDDKPLTLPTPPAGMIERSPDAIKEFREEYKRNFTEAYQAIGLGHISDQIFMSSSGISKRYDRAEAENMVMDVSNHFTLKLLRPVYEATDCIRYGPVNMHGQQKPTVKSPKRFDLNTIDATREELNDAMQHEYSEELKDSLQIKYLEQKDGKESDGYKILRIKSRLDPHRNKTDEMKSFLISQAYLTMDRKSDEFRETVKQIQFSINFEAVLRDAIMEDPDFYLKTTQEQYAILMLKNETYFSIRPADQPIEMSTLAPLVNAKDVDQMNE
jgi:hypothetical protein